MDQLFAKETKLPTQTEKGGAGACTVIAACCADSILARGDLTDSDACSAIGMGSALWRALVADSARFPSNYLTPSEVVSSVLDAKGRPRWRIWKEVYGVHATGVSPEVLARFEASGPGTGNIPLGYAKKGLSDALKAVDAELTYERNCVAALLTTGSPAHTVAVGSVLANEEASYFYVDSLNGLLAKSNAPSVFVSHATSKTPSLVWTAEHTAALEEDGAARRNMPGQFMLCFIELVPYE